MSGKSGLAAAWKLKGGLGEWAIDPSLRELQLLMESRWPDDGGQIEADLGC